MKRSWHPLLLIAAALIAIAGLKYAEPLLVPVLFGATLAAISSPIATWAIRRGLPAAVGAIMALLVDVALLAFVGAMLALAGGELRDAVPLYLARASENASSLAEALSRRGIPVSYEDLTYAFHIDRVASLVSGAAATAVDFASSLMVVVLVVFFTLCEFSGLGDKLRSVLHDEHVLVRAHRVAREFQTFLLVKTLSSFLVALFVFGMLKLLHVDLALLLSLILFVLHFVPNVGCLVAMVGAVVVALASRGPGTAAVVAVGYSLINLIVGNVLEPRILGRTLGLSPLVVLLGMLFWGWLWGTSGALLSVPLMMVTKIIFEHTEGLGWIARLMEPAPSAGEAPSSGGAPSNPLMSRASVPIGLGASTPGSAK